MCNIFDIPREWAESDCKAEAEAFEQALKRIKPMDNIHKAYHRGYAAGYKAAEDRIGLMRRNRKCEYQTHVISAISVH